LTQLALQSDLQNFGGKHPNVALRKWILGVIFHKKDRFSESKPLLEEAYQLYLEIFGESHPHTQMAKESLDYTIQRLEEA